MESTGFETSSDCGHPLKDILDILDVNSDDDDDDDDISPVEDNPTATAPTTNATDAAGAIRRTRAAIAVLPGSAQKKPRVSATNKLLSSLIAQLVRNDSRPPPSEKEDKEDRFREKVKKKFKELHENSLMDPAHKLKIRMALARNTNHEAEAYLDIEDIDEMELFCTVWYHYRYHLNRKTNQYMDHHQQHLSRTDIVGTGNSLIV